MSTSAETLIVPADADVILCRQMHDLSKLAKIQDFMMPSAKVMIWSARFFMQMRSRHGCSHDHEVFYMI
jgi:hypothetical protein